MRILHVVQRYWPALGGAERHYQQFAERLAAEGHDVAVYTTDALDLELFWASGRARVPKRVERLNGVTIRRFPVRHLPLHSKVYYLLARLLPWRTAQLLVRPPSPLVPGLFTLPPERWDVVATGAMPINSVLYAALRIARRAGARLLVLPFCHIGEAPDDAVSRHYATPPQVWLLNQADHVVAMTERERRYLIARGVEPHRLAVIPPGVDPAALAGGDGARFRARHSIRGPIVAYVGMNAHDKGTEHLVLALQRLWAEGEEVTLVLGGAALSSFERFLAAQGPLPRLLRLGRIEEEEKRDLFAAAQVVAMPSRTDSFGQLFLEAWCYGLPVVGAAAGGIPDVIADGETGFLVPFGDVPALADRLRRLIREPELAARLGAAGRARTLAHWTWDAVYQQVRPLYLGSV